MGCRPGRAGRLGWMRLRACTPDFLIRGEHALVLAERLAVEDLGVQVEHPGGFEDEVRVPREDPRPVLPRL
jgi:hypothetical protein